MAKDVKGKGSAEQGLIRELAELLDETGLSEIEVEREGLRVRVARRAETIAYAAAPAPSAQPAAAPSPAPVQKSAPDDPAKHPGCVKSPMVGTAYLAPEPGAAPFVDGGKLVAQGQTIMII